MAGPTDALLKISDANGNLKKITDTEENYLAYQAGLQLAAAGTSEVASLNTSSGTTIGTFTNTRFDQAVGSHPGSAISTTTTNVTIKQVTGTASENVANFTKPVLYDKFPGEIEAANSSQMNAIADRLIGKIFVNDYPGTYKLATSAPSGYTAHLSNVFTDTRTDGHSVNYSIYKRQTMTEPTVVKAIKLVPGGTGGTKDLKGMTNTEAKVTFGQRVKTRIMSSTDNIGAYQIRSSAQGAPSASGTWVAKGTATDTKLTTADANYTRTSTRTTFASFDNTFTRNSQVDYITAYTGTYAGDYVGFQSFDGTAFTLAYVGNYDGPTGPNFTRNSDGAAFEGNYEGGFNAGVGYEGNYEADYEGTYTCDSTADFGGPANPFTGLGFAIYTGNFEGNYDGAYQLAFTRDSSITVYYLAEFAGDYVPTYVGDYTSTFDGDYTGNYVPTYDAEPDFIGEYVGNYDEEYTGDFAGDYVADYEGDFVGNYVGNYAGETIQAGSTTIETYTLYVRTA